MSAKLTEGLTDRLKSDGAICALDLISASLIKDYKVVVLFLFWKLLKLIKMIYFSIPPTILPTKLSEPEFAVVCSGPFDDGLTVPFMVGATRTLPVPR